MSATKKKWVIEYIKDGKKHVHRDIFERRQDALGAAHELVRDFVADFTRVRLQHFEPKNVGYARNKLW
jgi:predicted transcriptional regulator